jgi:hypothetical protein
MSTPLTGSELLATVKRLEADGASKNELALETGYFTVTKDGKKRVNSTSFYEALLEAKGVTIGGSSSGKKSTGRKLTFRTKVQFNGNLMIGSAYTGAAGFEPGDEFTIVVGKKGFTLKLANSVPAESTTEDAAEQDGNTEPAEDCPMPESPADGDTETVNPEF